MGMSKQTTFTLTFLVAISAIVPGSAGYLSAKMDAVEQARRELVSLESRLRQERHEELAEEIELARQARRSRAVTAAAPTPCVAMGHPGHDRGRQPPKPAAIVPEPMDHEAERLLQERLRGEKLLGARINEKIIREGRRLAELERRRKNREYRENLLIPGLSAGIEEILPPEHFRRVQREHPAPESPQPGVPAN
jgi:hypothetical protein